MNKIVQSIITVSTTIITDPFKIRNYINLINKYITNKTLLVIFFSFFW